MVFAGIERNPQPMPRPIQERVQGTRIDPWIGVGNGCRRPLPPHPVCNSPATGPPVSCFLIGIGAPIGEFSAQIPAFETVISELAAFIYWGF